MLKRSELKGEDRKKMGISEKQPNGHHALLTRKGFGAALALQTPQMWWSQLYGN